MIARASEDVRHEEEEEAYSHPLPFSLSRSGSLQLRILLKCLNLYLSARMDIKQTLRQTLFQQENLEYIIQY